jgi:predicted RNA binding protein YcfA (HicA-like mRNA interferase family)
MYEHITGRELIKVLERMGFVLMKRVGSHALMTHREKNLVVTIPDGPGPLRPSTLQAILRQIQNFNIATGAELATKLRKWQ